MPTWSLLPLELRGLLHCNLARQPITLSQLLRPESRFLLKVPCFKGKNRTLSRSNKIPSSIVSVVSDTLEVLHNQHPARIRVGGIDCPEEGHACGTRAKPVSSELVSRKDITLQTHDVDQYGYTMVDVMLLHLNRGRSTP